MRVLVFASSLFVSALCIPTLAAQGGSVEFADRAKAEAPNNDTLFPAPLDGDQWGYIDRAGAVVIAPQFDLAYPFAEERARVQVRGRTRYIDREGAFVGSGFRHGSDFANGYARVVRESDQDSLLAYMDTEGTLATPFRYVQGTDFAEGIAAVRLPHMLRRWFLLDETGEESRTYFVQALQPSEGLVPVQFYSRFLALFRLPSKWGYVDLAGEEAIPPQFDVAFRFSEGLAAVGDGSMLGYIDATGTVRIAPQFRNAGPFMDGRARVETAEGWGFIDPEGTQVIPAHYEQVFDYSEGLAWVREDGRWGLVDASGAAVLAPRYGYVRPFRDGLAYVRDGEREGYIDRAGVFVWERAR